MHVERTFAVPRPVDAVFDYLSDFARTEEWDPGTVTTERTSGDGGVGTRYANTSQFMGRRVELVYETTVHERPRELKFRGTNDGATATDWLRLSPRSADATEVHYRADFVFTSRWVRLAAPLLRRRLDRIADETVEQMSRVIVARA